jgi:hypothetical protein
VVYKGRIRDIAWLSVNDSDWPQVGAALQEWLSPGNFDADGRQKLSLTAVRAAGARELTERPDAAGARQLTADRRVRPDAIATESA